MLALLKTFLIAYAGFFALALTMTRHRRQLLPRWQILPSPWLWTLRAVGWTGLATAAVLCVGQQGFGIGLTLWAGLLSAAALGLTLLATYMPKLALGLALAILLPFLSTSDTEDPGHTMLLGVLFAIVWTGCVIWLLARPPPAQKNA